MVVNFNKKLGSMNPVRLYYDQTFEAPEGQNRSEFKHHVQFYPLNFELCTGQEHVPNSDAMEDSLSLFQSIGLSEAKAKDTIKNTLVSNALKSLIVEVRVKVT